MINNDGGEGLMKKVLLASNSERFLERNTELLLQRGFQIFTVTSGEAALKLYNENHVDLIVADNKLTDMLGHNLCYEINSSKHLRQVPTVLITGNTAEDMIKAAECGVNTILQKPIEPNKLLAAITSAIDLQAVRSKRVALNVDVLCKEPELDAPCLAHNISNSGILIETDKLAVGTQVKCEFKLPDSKHVEVEGEVVRIATSPEEKPLCGIKFINTSMTSLRSIISYVVSTANSSPDRVIPNYPSQHCDCT